MPQQAIVTTMGKEIKKNKKMFFLGPAPARRQFIIIYSVLILLCNDHADAQGDPIQETTQFPCYNTENYTSDSPFQTNLNILLSSLVSSGSQNGFFNTSTGISPDKFYGLVQCRGDISQDSCRSCLDNASVELVKRCPNRKVATLRYDDCILRYSDTRFFSQVDYAPRSEFSPALLSDDDDARFSEQVRSLLTNMSGVAASTPNQFDFARIADGTSSGKRVDGWVQCNEDLSPANCTSCVQNLISEIRKCCDKRPGAKIFSATCYLRYEQQSDTAAPPPPSTEPRDTDGPGNGRSSTNAAVIIVPTIASALLLGICGYFISRGTRKNRRNPRAEIIYDQDDSISVSEESLQFDFNTIRTATNNFSYSNKLGQGGFGSVYKGELLNGQEIAVKRLSERSSQGSQEFKNEVVLLNKLQHRNLVRLLGYCLYGEEKLLIYEYVRNKSLDKYIFDAMRTSYLNWESRYKIIGGIARALLYLHEDSRLRIIHRDLKAGNVLLDEEMNAKVADFGMARLFGADQTRGNTSRVAGTLGYMAPEYLTHGIYSTKSDVFSFGVLVLEIVSGQSISEFQHSGSSWSLLSYAWKVWKEASPLDLIDPILINNFSVNEATRCIHIALLCVQNDLEARPSVSSVVLMLNSYSFALQSPSAPAFTTETITALNDQSKSLSSNDEDLTLPR